MVSAASGQAVPSWLHDLFLGYGDPAAAHYKSLQVPARALLIKMLSRVCEFAHESL